MIAVARTARPRRTATAAQARHRLRAAPRSWRRGAPNIERFFFVGNRCCCHRCDDGAHSGTTGHIANARVRAERRQNAVIGAAADGGGAARVQRTHREEQTVAGRRRLCRLPRQLRRVGPNGCGARDDFRPLNGHIHHNLRQRKEGGREAVSGCGGGHIRRPLLRGAALQKSLRHFEPNEPLRRVEKVLPLLAERQVCAGDLQLRVSDEAPEAVRQRRHLPRIAVKCLDEVEQ